MGDCNFEYSHRSGNKMRYFYKHKNVALCASWCENENIRHRFPSLITLCISDKDIEIDNNGRIASLSYSTIPLTYAIHESEILADDRFTDKNLLVEIVNAFQEAKAFILEKEKALNEAKAEML